MAIPAITNETIFTLDWSANDPRSVKAYLTGKGDGRTLWWILNHHVHKLIWQADTLEAVMYSFHTRHHRITFATLGYVSNVQTVAQVVRDHGLLAGIREAIAVTKTPFR